MLRRLENRIREQCSEALTAPEPELATIFSNLKSALHEHTERVRQLVAARLASDKDAHRQERRSP
jgi:hypothetical protein